MKCDVTYSSAYIEQEHLDTFQKVALIVITNNITISTLFSCIKKQFESSVSDVIPMTQQSNASVLLLHYKIPSANCAITTNHKTPTTALGDLHTITVTNLYLTINGHIQFRSQYECNLHLIKL